MAATAPAAGGFGSGPLAPAGEGVAQKATALLYSSVDLLRGGNPSILAVLYTLIVGVAIAIIILVIDYYVPFLPINPISGPSAAARAGKTFWKNSSNADENLMVTPTDSPTTLPDKYTMSVQMVIADSRTPDLGRFRHVVHRGANPCGLTATKSGPTGHAGVKPEDIPPSGDPSYARSGLPPLMNPGLMLDNYKNDLHVFVHTRGSEKGEPVLWLESLTVEDLPLNTPVTIGVVCNGQAVEVYVNCRLYGTLLLRGQPYLPAADNMWFGRYCAFPFAGLVKNLQLWGSALSTGDYAAMCGGAADFSGAQMPSTCPTAGSITSGWSGGAANN